MHTLGTSNEEGTSESSVSDRSLRTAMKWIQDCCDTHVECNTNTTNRDFWPTRILDLGGTGSYDSKVRLVLSAEHAPEEHYATLSHCWGGLRTLQLTRTTIERFCKSIEIAAMPKTFQDAVQVARQLHIRYLWIDSLCILQDADDLSDWRREAGLMHRVYSNSHCNISASWAANSTEGLFPPSERSAPKPNTINLRLRDRFTRTIRLGRYVVVDAHSWQRGSPRRPVVHGLVWH
jgi:hypothetical protein